MTNDDTNTPHDEKTIRNVDLQFMGKEDTAEEIDAEVNAESREAGAYRERGMDKHDVESAQSMDASDPPSSNMGDES
ncbi:M-like protein [Deinococcus knuensis]|uniref:M-like protein n=1 Tax=Deinococcus knuensis TaxID=1837380 RepID=A0ABQ2SE67_9DEIO|nr:M-like protein [Deinococcus knuensis]GGS24642.1 M-like protein [Deinococcus knuensis]